jgi:hypothetical protein
MSITSRTALLSAALALWACWAGEGRGAAPAAGDPQAVASAIDRAIDRRLAEARIPASAQCSDAEFLRRLSLDLTGRIPPARRVSDFLADRRPDRRRRLVDELLASDTYGRTFGTIWYHLLVAANDDNRFAIDRKFEDWLARQFNNNRGWDQIVTDMLTAHGRRSDAPATVFWFAHVEGPRTARVKPGDALGTASQRFLGVRYQCAECHNHPFTGFKQADFWSLAAFLGKTEVKGASKKNVKQGATPSIRDLPAGTGVIRIPESNGKTASPRFPDGTPYQADGKSLRSAFARWCTSNPAFARAAVNRLWGHLFGRGFVDPVDDFREDIAPTHPGLLDLLSREFVASGHDLKHLIRCICLSRAYQRSSDALPGNADDDKLRSHAAVKLMSTDMLFESLSVALGREVVSDRRGARNRKQVRGPRVEFLRLFDTADERDFSTEYNHGIPQVLRLMNGIDVSQAPTLQRLQKAGGTPDRIVEGLYLAVLSRLPGPAERKKAVAHVGRASTRALGYADLMWALLNSSEFILNH